MLDWLKYQNNTICMILSFPDFLSVAGAVTTPMSLTSGTYLYMNV